MRLVYMGTPDFAVAPLLALLAEGHEISAVFPQPDKPKGRSGRLVPPPVKLSAMEHGLRCCQPEKLREPENAGLLRELAPDAIVVAAYGQILPEEILSIPRLGCINIHASLLPKYRGAAPIERAILDGESETGVTAMYMAKGLDTGDMLDKAVVRIEDDDTAESLTKRLSEEGARMIGRTLKALEDGTARPEKQNDAESTYAAKLTKEEGRMDFTKSAALLSRMVRAFHLWPGAYTTLLGKTVKLYGVKALDQDTGGAVPGKVIGVTKKNFTIACGQGALLVTSLQPEGKKQMDTAAYLNGAKLSVGEKAGA